MSDQVRHVVFDLDGTLVDSAAGILKSMTEALSTKGFEAKVAMTPDIIGPPLMKTLALVAGTDAPEVLAELAAEFKRQYDGMGYRSTEPYPGVGESLRQLRDHGVKLHIATNKRGVPTRLLLDHLDWADFFHSVYCLDEYQQCADKAQMLALLLAEQSIHPTATVYVGDTEGDAIAAKSNQVPFLHASWGYGANQLSAPADYVCDDAKELAALLHKHLSA